MMSDPEKAGKAVKIFSKMRKFDIDHLKIE